MATLSYKPLFDPDDPGDREIPELRLKEGDSEADPVYVYTDLIKLAVNVALATGRPLLLRGDPGSGKSSLARHVAWTLGWRYYPKVITSRTRAHDLQWQFDALRRLQDAQVSTDKTPKEDLNPVRYIKPGVLWWALDQESAQYHGIKVQDREGVEPLDDPAQPIQHHPAVLANPKRAVVLLDEIDKADPDVPNNLLEVLGARHFTVDETKADVRGLAPLVFITTNDERELPGAFLRRCVILILEAPNEEQRFKDIARAHFPEDEKDNGAEDAEAADTDSKKKKEAVSEELIDQVYKRLMKLTEDAKDQNLRVPSIAEFLDTLRACHTLEIKKGDEDWKAITQATLWKAKELPKSDLPPNAPSGEEPTP